jgi:hypothetical protein
MAETVNAGEQANGASDLNHKPGPKIDPNLRANFEFLTAKPMCAVSRHAVDTQSGSV